MQSHKDELLHLSPWKGPTSACVPHAVCAWGVVTVLFCCSPPPRCSPASRSFSLQQYPCAYPHCPFASRTNKAASILRTLFQVAYPNKSFACLACRNCQGLGTNNSHSGSTPKLTRHSPFSTRQNIQ